MFDRTMKWGNATYSGLTETPLVNNSSLKALNSQVAPGFLDFTKLTQDKIDEILNDKSLFFSSDTEVSVTGCGTGVDGIPIQIVKEFTKTGFGDIILTGANGISMLTETHNFMIGASNSIPVTQTYKWTAKNVNESSYLDFNKKSIDRLYITGMDLSPAKKIILREDADGSKGDYLKDFSLTNSTYPAGIFSDDRNSWSDVSKVKNIANIEFQNVSTNNIVMNNFNKANISIGGISATSFGRSKIEISKLGGEGNPLPIKVTGDLCVETININDSYITKNLNLTNNINRVNYLTISDVNLAGDENTAQALNAAGNQSKEVTIGAGTRVSGNINVGAGTATYEEGYPRLTVDDVYAGGLIVNDCGSDTPVGFSKVSIKNSSIETVKVLSSASSDSKLNTLEISQVQPFNKSFTVTLDGLGCLSNLNISNNPKLSKITAENLCGAYVPLERNSWIIAGNGSEVSGTELALSDGPKTLTLTASDSENMHISAEKDFVVPNTVQSLVIEGTEMADNAIKTGDDSQLKSLDIGTTLGNHYVSLNTLDLQSATSLSKIRLFGSAPKISTIKEMNMTGLTGIQTFEPSNVNDNDKVLAVTKLIADQASLPNNTFRNMITAVGDISGGNGGEFSAVGAVITGTSRGLLNLGAPGESPREETELYYTDVYKEQATAYLYEQLAVSTSPDAGPVAAAAAQAKLIHSPYCQDEFTQNRVPGGVLSDCTTSCVNFEENGRRFHYHAPDGTGLIVMMESFREDKKPDAPTQKIQTGTMAVIPGRATDIYFYKAGELHTTLIETVTVKNEDGTETTKDLMGSYYDWAPAYKSIAHINHGLNASHDPSNHEDGCVICVTLNDATGTKVYYQPWSWSVSNSVRINTGSVNIDTTHLADSFAPVGENGSEPDGQDKTNSGRIMMSRLLFLGSVEENNTARNQKLESFGLINETIDDRLVITKRAKIPTGEKEEHTRKYMVGGSADDRCGSIDITDVTVDSGIPNLNVSLTNLTKLVADRGTFSSSFSNVTISTACEKLSDISLKNSKTLGTNGFTIGEYEYKPISNWVSINGMWDCDNLGSGSVLGEELSAGESFDWYKKWLPSLTSLKMSGCNIKCFANDDCGTNENFYIRFGSEIEPAFGTNIGHYKKYKEKGFCSQSSTGYMQFNDTTICYYHIDGSTGNTPILYQSGNTVKGNDNRTLGINLENQSVKITIYDQSTKHYDHSWAFVLFPFGS